MARQGVDCYATLILGMDWDEGDFRGLGQWLGKMELTFINLQPFTPLPGTAMQERHRSGLIIPRTDYEKWDLAHLVMQPERMSTARYYWNILKLYYTTSMRPANLLKLLVRHGLRANLKMLAGSSRISFQYLHRILESRRGHAS